MKRVLQFTKGYRIQAILAPLFKLLEALMDLFVPLVVARIVNVGIKEGSTQTLIGEFALLIGLAALGLGFSITAQFFAARASVGTATALRQGLFNHIMNLSYTELDTQGTNTLINRLTSDVNQVQTGINMGLRLLLRSPFIVFGSMVMAFTIDTSCALIFVVAIPVLSVVVFGIMLSSIPLFKKVQGALDKLLGSTRENLSGVRIIRAFRKEEDEVRDFDAKNNTLTKMNLFVGRISALMNPLTYLLINLATIFLIQQGAVQVSMGNIQQGDVLALYNYMAQMIVELIKLASLIITINKSVACAGRVSKIFDLEPSMVYPEISAKTASNEEIVRFNNVTFEYQGAGAPSVSHISFAAKKGQTIGIIGGTGSGKSTVIDLIPRLYDATEGSVEIDGTDVRNYIRKDLLDKIGLVPQKAVLFKGTVRENMKWGNEEANDQEIWDALAAAQAKDVVENKEGQLDFEIEQGGRNLSGGQRQRLTIARALVRKPEILILDDSASALDFATDAALRSAIRSFSGKMTTFIVSQRAASIRHADQILVMDDGELVGTGTHEELMKNNETYQEIYYSQFPEERPGVMQESEKEVLA